MYSVYTNIHAVPKMDPPFFCAFFSHCIHTKTKKVAISPPTHPRYLLTPAWVICEGGQAEMSSAARVSAGPDGVVSGVSRFHFLPLGVTKQPCFWWSNLGHWKAVICFDLVGNGGWRPGASQSLPYKWSEMVSIIRLLQIWGKGQMNSNETISMHRTT